MTDERISRDPGAPALRVTGVYPGQEAHVPPLHVHQTGTGPAALVSADVPADGTLVVRGGIRVVDAQGAEKAAITADGLVTSAETPVGSVWPMQGRGIDPTGVVDSTAGVQAFLAGVPSGGTVQVPAGAVVALSDTVTLSRPVTLVGPGELRWTSGIAEKAALSITSPGVELSGALLTNPNALQSQTGGRNIGVKIQANDVRVDRCTIVQFQNGVSVSADGEWKNIFITRNRIKDVIGAGDGQSSSSGNGEDRGDGIVTWGAHATITGNIINAKSGTDARIGIHMEALPEYEVDTSGHPDALTSISGNIIWGQFRRGVVVEDGGNAVISGNSIADPTWWGIAVIGATNSSSKATRGCLVTGNTVLWTRTAADNAGSSWNPQRAPFMLYGGALNVVLQGNTARVPGSSPNSIVAQAVDSTRYPVGCQILDNTIAVEGTGTIDAGIMLLVKSDKMTIRGNAITGFSAKGIYPYAASNVSIVGNKLDAVSSPGTSFGVYRDDTNVSPAIISGNMILNVYKGFHLVNSQTASITGNTVATCTTGFDLFGTTNSVLAMNIVKGATTAYANISGATSTSNLTL